ncbi:type IIL restriction-modification enzyme MmeI [Synechococcus sp. PCC 6312]|uniref:type IIL restriction-modification enzyme MmeI n=1 Tax=Synechococcus sp. (strain ATCC 27167 / PCC 6312) TaxID=195253 RepID=UPI0002DF34FD|nr:type IIL restriction-modification enzyme MmeI [Synechococcus sp. PCC 6312]
MPSTDLDTFRHQEWLGLLQPVGLVVSPPALIKAQAVIDRAKLVDIQERLQAIVSTEAISPQRDEGIAWIKDFPAFTQQVLNWMPQDLVATADLPDNLSAVLPSYGETLRPTYGVKDPDSDQWILLIQELSPGLPFDEDDPAAVSGQGWQASFQAKFERLLRETGIAAGVLVNATEIRLVYAPSGESSGYLTFPVQAMTEVPGRLILGALDLLLGADRLFNVPENQRLGRLLVESRNYQAQVSTQLAQQVLDALWELLRGFQAADAAVNGNLLRKLAENDPQHIYGGLITTLMRLVFLLYAEDEGLMPDDEVYQRHYAVSGLYEKLREDAGNYPDTMDQRYGAWATLLSLFRLVYDGGGADAAYLPARHGQLFDPDEYPFLEGRPQASQFQSYGRVAAPRIPDGVIYRMLDKLLMLNGERLSYRALDVEQIGSVYEAIMGYEVEVAESLSIAVRPKDVVVNLEALLAEKPGSRDKVLKKEADCELTAKGATALKQAKTVDDIMEALGSRVSSRTPNLLPPGSLYLQPGEERRRTGSHYTPRKLTQPIVATTLRPIFEQLGDHPTPEQILELKVCDLAMGSAAFLVEACRQLAEKLVEAWDTHGQPADLPAEIEPLLYARRLVGGPAVSIWGG